MTQKVMAFFMANGTTPIPFDTSGNISYTTPTGPAAQVASTYGGLEKGYADAINSQPTVPLLTSQANDRFGVPQLQQQVQSYQAQGDQLQDEINNASKTVGQASQQSILTQGQRDAAVQNLTTPLQQQLGTINTNLTRTQANLGTAQTNASQDVAAQQAQQLKQLQPWTQQFSDEAVIAAQQETQWTQQDADQLNVLLSNQKTGLALTEDEQNNLNALAQKEQDFENNLKLQQDKEANTITPITSSDIGLYRGGANGTFTNGSVWS